MRDVCICVLTLLALVASCQAGTLKMPEAPDLEIESATAAYPFAIAVRFADDLPSAVYVVKTSPFDKMRYPIGEYSVATLMKNIGKVFRTATDEGSSKSADGVVGVLELKIESFDAVIPRPAYKPYTAEVVYRASVLDPEGNVVFTEVASGSAQTSKGMMSGFKAKGLAAEAAARAMNDAMAQLLEGLLDAEELRALVAVPETQGES